MDTDSIYKGTNYKNDPTISERTKNIIIKREVLDMILDNVFPEKYAEPFFERFPHLSDEPRKYRKNFSRLRDVFSSRSTHPEIVQCLRIWYKELTQNANSPQ